MDKIANVLSWGVMISGTAVCIAGGIFIAYLLLDLVGYAMWRRLLFLHGIVKINRAAKALREGEQKAQAMNDQDGQ